MHTNTTTSPAFKTRQQKERLTPKGVKCADWKGTLLGQAALVLIHELANEMLSDDQRLKGRKFNRRRDLFDRLLKAAPWVLCWYASQTEGKKLNSKIVMDRLNNMYYVKGEKGKGGKAQISNEHPSQCIDHEFSTKVRKEYQRIGRVSRRFLEGN